ncbi:MAG: T9SS type A sorting domain-containing protein [Bacteroidia bacterium]|nr:T9SS type A sorting domain-containing protein [Bacteroidia bacterium]
MDTKIIYGLLFCLFFSDILFGQEVRLDSTFGTGGKVSYDFGNAYSNARDVLIQHEGKIVVGGYTLTANNSDFSILRLLTNGQIDSSFATNGYRLSNSQFDGNDYGFSFTQLSDSSFILTGASQTTPSRPSSGVVRYDTSGVQKMFVNFNVGPLADSTFKAVVLPNGNILIGGWDGLNIDFCLLGILPNLLGPDPIFGTEAKVCISDSEMSRMYDMALQSDGKILAVGESKFRGEKDFIIARFNSDGSLDSSFAVHGIFRQDFNSNKESAFVVLPTFGSKTLIAGTGSFKDSLGFNMIRLNSSGQLDTTFGDSGIVRESFTLYPGGKSLIKLPDGKLIAVGSRYNGASEDFVLAGFTIDGIIDSTFGQNGMLLTDFEGTDDRAYSVTYDSSSHSLFVVGESVDDTSAVFAIAKYNLGARVGLETFPSIIQEAKLYPNPSKSGSQLKFSLQNSSSLTIDILDLQGRSLRNIIRDQFFYSGAHEVDVAMDEIPAGVYTLRMLSRAGFSQIVRFVKLP